jgi:integral membrane sensor domain MASE1
MVMLLLEFGQLFLDVGALATTFIVIPIVAWMSKKMEKKKAFLISQGNFCLWIYTSLVSFCTR